MSTLKVSKDSKGYLQPTIEGAATIEEHEALKAAHQVRIQQKTNGIYAISLAAAIFRPVIKNRAEVRAAFFASDFSAFHTVTRIFP